MDKETLAKAKQWLRVDAELGRLFWILSPCNAVSAGALAGCAGTGGYRRVGIFGAVYPEHHLIWALTYGNWPSKMIDHINHVTDDNRPSNLRLADAAENGQNRVASRNSATGLLGVSVHKRTGKFQASINLHGRYKYLGLYETPELAHAAYCKEKKVAHLFNPFVHDAVQSRTTQREAATA